MEKRNPKRNLKEVSKDVTGARSRKPEVKSKNCKSRAKIELSTTFDGSLRKKRKIERRVLYTTLCGEPQQLHLPK
jgi:hypothetical protein